MHMCMHMCTCIGMDDISNVFSKFECFQYNKISNKLIKLKFKSRKRKSNTIYVICFWTDISDYKYI